MTASRRMGTFCAAMLIGLIGSLAGTRAEAPRAHLRGRPKPVADKHAQQNVTQVLAPDPIREPPGDGRESPSPSTSRLLPPPGPIGGAIWLASGPAPIINGQIENVSPNDEVSGAMHTLAAHPIDPDTLYAGSVNGGVWKTTNAAAASPTWTPLTDFFPALSIGALEFDLSDTSHQTLVAGIGRFSSFGRVGPQRTGLLYTFNGGASWAQLDGGGILVDKNISGVASYLFGAPPTIVVSVNATPTNACSELGIFRSVDAGASFTRVSGMGFGLPSSRSYDLVADPSFPGLLYTVADCAESCDVGGNGIYRSIDFGASWAKVSTPLMDSKIVCGTTSNVELAVGSGGAVYAAILNSGQIDNGGLFQSLDSGGSWTQMDVPIVPDGAGFPIADASNTTPIVILSFGHGLSSGTRVNVTGVTGNTAANDLFTVNVLDGNTFQLNGSAGNGAYTGGGQWTRVVGVNPTFKDPEGDIFEAGSQGSIHYSMRVSPTDDLTVYIGGDRQDTPFPNFIGAVNFSGNLWRGDFSIATTGGALSPQWEHLTHSDSVGAIPAGGTASTSSPHADSREMAFDALGRLIESDDGGVYRRTSPGDNTGDWFSINGNLQVTEMHDVAYDTISNVMFGGNQDVGTAFQLTPGGTTWDNSFTSGDGGDVAVDARTLAGLNQSIRYSSSQRLQAFRRSTWNASNVLLSISVPSLVLVGGGTPLLPGTTGAPFKTPVELNAIDPTRLVIGGTSSVYESLDQGNTISEIGPGIGVNNLNADPIAYGGTSVGVDNPDVLYIGSGASVRVRTAAAPAPLVATAYAGAFVMDIVLDPIDWMKAYVVDNAESVWRTTDAGATWSNITGDLVDVGEHYAIEFMRNTQLIGIGANNYVVVGADRGVFVSNTDTLGTWNEAGTNLPNAIVYDLDYDPADDILAASTMGRGAWMVVPATICGDGAIEGLELCDDGDGDNGDGCSSACLLEVGFNCTGEPSVCTAICGDGLVLGSEFCDDGFADACGSCNPTCTGPGAGSTCGDNVLCPETEECDDGNTEDGDACPGNCLFNTVCDRADPIPCGSVLSFDNSAFSNSPSPSYSCGSGSNHSGTLWFKFTAAATSARLFSCASAMIDSTFAVYAGSCGALVEIGCSEDDFLCSAPFLGDICLGGLTPGSTYYIQFSAWSAADRGSYTLELRCPCTCGDGVTDPPDEECDGADDAACPGECQANCACPECIVDADCDDGDLCTWDQCTGQACTNTANVFGDVNHDGMVDIFDILCVLDGFAGVFTTCPMTDVELAPCPDGDGIIDIFDILAVLDAFSGTNTCNCPAGP
ncbi:MAG: hypothetical protein HOP29_09585 [Phycisphaerales bacterium]|nr:hypothetical protein [Phycisphaerales bacterium]